MLKGLVRERLMAAADEIFALFERTIASYEEELCRAGEENERHRQMGAVSKTRTLLYIEDVQQLIGHQEERPPQPQEGSSALKHEEPLPPSVKEEEDPHPPHVKEEEEELWCLFGPEEADLIKLPLTGVSVKTEDREDRPPEENRGVEPPSSSSPQRTTTEAGGGSQAGSLLSSQSDGDDTTSRSPEAEDGGDTREVLICDTDSEGDTRTHTDSRDSEKKTDVHKLIGGQEERPAQQQQSLTWGGWGSSCSRVELAQPLHVKGEEDPQPPRVKDEEEELWITQQGECLLAPEEADLSKLPLTVVSVKTEEDVDEPQDDFSAPLSDNDDTTSRIPGAEGRDDAQEPLSSDTDCEVDTRTHTAHRRSEGPEKKKKCLTCPVCAKSFSDKRYFPLHMRTHTGEKPFSCSICDKRFSQNSHMLSHMRTHTGEKPFSCSVCGERFSKKSNIVKHMRTHTGEKPFSCSVCGASFAQRFTLKRHMTTHTREKPFSCSVCGEGFAVQMSLIRHQRTHTGEKPFSCPVCDKRFSHKSNMTAHMRTHTGEKAFSCSVCGKSYSYKTSLTIHMRTHSGE
ncbi:zinc finger protein 391-like [Dunckerocampus dactyliophorus]|uniref:zinc finger protein 391-like n=1 Tax=Dunckerocampus dactyliophorus TaxID=161453 RepID=UPI002405CB02|nr:zinc finger protein 391-like [Dunckerocampus dactyliophorus]